MIFGSWLRSSRRRRHIWTTAAEQGCFCRVAGHGAIRASVLASATRPLRLYKTAWADDEQLAQIAVAHLRDPAQSFLAAQCGLSWRQSQIGRKLARTGKARSASGGGCTYGQCLVSRQFATFAVAISIGSSTSIVLKNSEIEPPRKSRFGARRVISADSLLGRACGTVARGKTGRSAEPLRNFSSKPPAVF
jgi:hypothetical protein